MADADNSENFAMGLEILPGTGRRAADHELEAKVAGFPRLVGERALLVLCVEGTDSGE